MNPRYAICLLGLLAGCQLITFDCGGPTVRSAVAQVVMSDQAADTIHIRGMVSQWEEKKRDGSYTHQLVVTLSAADAAHYDTIQTALRPHVTGVRVELASGQVLYRSLVKDNTSHMLGPPALAVEYTNSMDQALYNSIRQFIARGELYLVVETDSPAIMFPKTRLTEVEVRDWVKTSGCT